MKTSAAGLALIREFEGLCLDAYDDGTGVLTIGYGHTPAIPGQRVTHAEAEAMFAADVLTAESAVRALIAVPLTQGQFDALVSFAFNLGAGRLRDSTLRELLNAGDYRGAQSQFRRWIFGIGKPMDGLRRRRAAEAELFGADPPAAKPPAPVVEATITPVEEKTMSPFIPIALDAITSIVPALAGIFGDKSKPVPERNTAAAVKVVETVREALGAKNEQEVVQRIQSDPAAVPKVKEAVESIWFELTEAGGGGIAGARKFASDHEGGRYGRVLEVVSYAALGFLAFANVAVLVGVVAALLSNSEHADQLLNQASILIQADIGAALTAFGFWLGSSVAKNRGTEVKTP